jgi:hypothetical protein
MIFNHEGRIHQKKKFARNFRGRTSTARIHPIHPKKYLLWMIQMLERRIIIARLRQEEMAIKTTNSPKGEFYRIFYGLLLLKTS